MEAFSTAYDGSHAPIVKTMQVWAEEVFTIDLLAVCPVAAHKVSLEFWETLGSLLEYVEYTKANPKDGFSSMEFRATREMFEPARSKASMATMTLDLVYDWVKRKMVVLPIDSDDIQRFALRHIPESLKSRIVLNKHLLVQWPVPLGRKRLTISSRVNLAVGLGAWRCRGFLSLDTRFSKFLILPVLSLKDICALFLEKIKRIFALFFSL